MIFEHKYAGSSQVTNNGQTTGLSFAPDTHREPTFFSGKLNKHLHFREAISALHDVVISDLRWIPKERPDYQTWLQEQESIWLAEAVARGNQTEGLIKEKIKELEAVRAEKSKVMGPFYQAQRKYFDYLYQKDMDAWYVLDPVITVHPDEIFFECFSEDESSYGKLSCSLNVFKEVGEFACGTTNIDYSRALYEEFQKIRTYKDTDFTIDPSGFEVQTTNEDTYKEVKIDLPDSWVRGFLQVSSAMTMEQVSFDLHPLDLANLLFVLKRNKEKTGPRSVRFILTPGQPIKITVDPWNTEIPCPRSIYKGNSAHEIRIWGRRRLLILERLIPVTDAFTVTLLGSGLPSFFEAKIDDMTFTLGLSGWTANDWSRMGQFDLMAPRFETEPITQQKVYLALKSTWLATPEELCKSTGLERKQVLGALSALVQAGRAIYDITNHVYRLRELKKDPIAVDDLRFSNEIEANAQQHVDRIKHIKIEPNDKGIGIEGQVSGKSTKIQIDADECLRGGSCTCNFYQQNKWMKGPCEHMIALRIKSGEKSSN